MAAKGRLRMADATTDDMASILEDWMCTKGSRDLCSLLSSANRQVAWKTAPKLEVLVEYSDLAFHFSLKAPSLVLGHSRLVAAIVGCHKCRPCLFSHMGLEQQAAACSGTIRSLLSKFRDCKQNAERRRILFSRAPRECKK